jgi:hypothetical protein
MRHETLMTLRQIIINYEDQFIINLMLNDRIEKKMQNPIPK